MKPGCCISVAYRCFSSQLPACSRTRSQASCKPAPAMCRRAGHRRVIPRAMYGRYNPGRMQNTPRDPNNAQGTRGSLSRAISSAVSWQQLLSLAASPAGQQLEAPHLAHMLTRLQQLVEQQPLTSQEAPLVQQLVNWIVRRSKQLTAEESQSRMGTPALGATAGALSRLRQQQEAAVQQQQAELQQQATLQRQQQEALRQRRQQQAAAQQKELLRQRQQLYLRQQEALRKQQEAELQRQQEAAAEQAAQQQEEAQRQAALLRRQQQQQQQWRAGQQQGPDMEEEEEEQAAEQARKERREYLRQLAQQALAQRHRLSPQVLNNLLTALAGEEAELDAQSARATLQKSRSAASRQQQQQQGRLQPPAAASATQSAAQQRRQQQQAGMDSGELRAAAKQLGKVDPALAREWHDAQLRTALAQGLDPSDLEPAALDGFLSREVQRLTATAAEGVPGGTSRALRGLVSLYNSFSPVLNAEHLGLMLQLLAEVSQQEEVAGQQVVRQLTQGIFNRAMTTAAAANPAAITLLLTASANLGLYSQQLLEALLARAGALLQQQAAQQVQEEQAFSGRQLGVLLHSLARLGLRPASSWLKVALAAAGDLLPGCSIVDFERLTTSLLMMRVTPSRPWVAAAEDQLERLINSHTPQDELQQEEWFEVVEAVVKALALLGGSRAALWYQDLQKAAAAEQEQATGRLPTGAQQQQQQQEQARWQEQQQAAGAAAMGGRVGEPGEGGAALPPYVRRQAAKRSRRPKASSAAGAATPAAGTPSKQPGSSRAGATSGMAAPALRSMDEWMTAALGQQMGPRDGSTDAAAASSAAAAKASTGQQEPDLPELAEVPEQPEPPVTGPTPAAGANQRDSEQDHPLQVPPPAEWAAEQAAKWAAAAAHEPSAAQELHQALDDSLDLVGSVPEVPRGRPGRRQGAAGTPAAAGGDGKAAGAEASSSRQIEVEWEKQPPSQRQQAAAPAKSGTDSSSSRRLADLMAEVDGAADDADMASARAEAASALGMGEESQEEGAQLRELQQAADAVQHASELLDQQLHSSKSSKAGDGSSKGKHKGSHSKHSKKHAGGKQPVQPAAEPAAAGPPLGFSGLKPFEAAAKTLSSDAPNKALLSGVLMAVEQQLGEMAAKAALSQQGLSGRLMREEAAAAADPVTRAVRTLQDDMARLRKRAAEDKALAKDTATADMVTALLPLLDSFDAAIAARQVAAAGTPGEETIHAAYGALHSQLLKVLQDEGVVTISELGVPFDPNRHEAVMRVAATDGQGDGEVVRCFRQGYQVGEKLVRPALVVVATTD